MLEFDLFLIFVLLLQILTGIYAISGGIDAFCGNLTIYKQKWFARTATTISSQTTIDLKECLNICCNIPNCNAVTFMGFIGTAENAQTSTNCMMFTCREDCFVVDKNVANEGVISVFINKTTKLLPELTRPNVLPSTAVFLPTAPPFLEPQNPQEQQSTTAPTSHGPDQSLIYRSELTPVWAVGIAIVIAIVCIGTNVALLSAWLCYRRQRSRMRRCEITTIKTPTLHAFNPTT